MNIETKMMEYCDEIEEKRMHVIGLMLSMHGIEKLLHPFKLMKYKSELKKLDKLEFSFNELYSERYESSNYERKVTDFIEKNPVKGKRNLTKCRYS